MVHKRKLDKLTSSRLNTPALHQAQSRKIKLNPHWDATPHLLEWLKWKTTLLVVPGMTKDMAQWEHLYIADSRATVENISAILYKVKYMLTIRSNITTLR